MATWQMVQSKMANPDKTSVVVDGELPLRGALKCHCGSLIIGTPSRSKSGKYFYYYKCRHSKHNNIRAIKAHNQFMEFCELMSLPNGKVAEIRKGCNIALETEMKANKQKAQQKKSELAEAQDKLFSVEEKWIKNEINRDTYDRWYTPYNSTILKLKGSIERLNRDQGSVFEILKKDLDLLTDIPYVYQIADTVQKREFVNMVFDNNLYYQDGIYLTPTMMKMLLRKSLKMKGLLIYQENGGDF